MKKEIFSMQGTVRWFNAHKGYGFITDSEGRDVFVHQSSINMDGFRHLNRNDFVSFELGIGNNGKEQAVNVKPVLTRKMIEDSLKEEGLYVKTMKDAYKMTKYIVVDANNVIQTSEHGMDFLNLAAYAGFDTEGLSA